MISHQIFPEVELVSVRLEDSVEFADVKRSLAVLARSDEYRQGYAVIVDLRDAKLGFHPRDMKKLVSWNRRLGLAVGSWVFLVHTPLETALAKTYQANARALHTVEVFYTVRAISQFLGRNVSAYIAGGELV
ncbi:MAG: hypothetical protein OEW58_02120 [Gammaproteobacteria bacterium]|nr:hypothetical protein [Gammaproteobacteria bacterium]